MTTGNISCTSLTVSGAVTTGTVVRPGFATTATAAGTTTLTAASAQIQEFTGTTTQTIVLPDVTTLSTGHLFNFISSTTGALTINSSGGNLVQTVNAGARATITCILASGTTAASWAVGFSLATTAAGAVSTNGGSLTAGAIAGTTGTFSGATTSPILARNSLVSAVDTSGVTGLYLGDATTGINVITREKIAGNVANTNIYFMYGNSAPIIGASFSYTTAKIYATGSEVGSFSLNGLAVTGTLTSSTGFGCNGAAAQDKYASGGALAGVVAALVANGILLN